MVAHYRCKGAAFHVFYKLVGGRKYHAVRQHGHAFLPPDATRRVENLLLHGRKRVVGTPCLVAHKTYIYGPVRKAGRQFFGRCDEAAAIVAQVNNQRVAGLQGQQYFVEVAVAQAVLKCFAANIAYVVVEDAVFQSRRYLIVGAKIASYERVAVIRGVAFVESPVACHVE